jgi:hypothetical protein
MRFPTIHRQARNDRGRGGLDQGDIGLALSAIMIAGVIDSFAVRRIERHIVKMPPAPGLGETGFEHP